MFLCISPKKLTNFNFKMSVNSMSKFLKALDNVKRDFTCGHCSEICKDPVTLSTCFHMICSDHFPGLKNCPTCNVSLKTCTVFVDEGLRATLPATKALDEMFKQFRVDKENAAVSSKGDPSASENAKKRRVIKNKDVLDALEKVPTQSTITPNNKVTKKREHKTSETLETTLTSTTSTKPAVKSLEKLNVKGETALHIACRLGKVDKVADLLNKGALTNTKDNAGWTPLHEVVQNGQIELVKLLIEHKALVNVPGQGNETTLHEAVRYGHIDIAVELVKNGADINARNIKGETPMDLASAELKQALDDAMDNIIQTQTVNVNSISLMQAELDYDDIKVYCVSQHCSVERKLKALKKHHTNITLETKFTKKVTHLVVDTENLVCTPSSDVLQGIVYGIWILSADWITNSTTTALEPFEKYEVSGVGTTAFNGPKNARYNKYKQLPGLFDGCHFYLHNFVGKYEISKQIELTKASLSKLITDAGGVVLRRVPNPEAIPESEKLVPYHAKKGGKLVICSHYIIFKDMYQPMYNMKHLKALPVGWLIECLEKYELCEP